MSADAKIEELGLKLPPAPKPGGVYKPMVIVGNLAYLSGHGPLLDSGEGYETGRVGDDLDLAAGQAAARRTGLALLASMQAGLGSLNRVKRVIKVLGLVNSTDDFAEQPQVMNGFSELMAEVFGPDAGVGARSALATNVLPGNIPVEIEMIIEIDA
jgi:enamine deaminase RidA (YjgF/YER057c/UK114 family)